jgi:membrane protease YdiL (CAAX protease family)
MLSAVARKFNLPWAIGLSSFIFCLLHYNPGLNWLVILNLVLFSLFACAWVLRKNSLWGIMGWHAGWNWLLATGFELPVTGLDLKLPALLVALSPQVLTT